MTPKQFLAMIIGIALTAGVSAAASVLVVIILGYAHQIVFAATVGATIGACVVTSSIVSGWRTRTT